MLLSSAAAMRRSRALAAIGRAVGLGVEFGPHGGSRRAGIWLKSRARGRRAALVRRNPDLHRDRGGDRAIPRHHRAAPRAAALRRALVPHWCIRMDDNESYPRRLYSSLHNFRHQQRGISWSLHPLHSGAVAYASGLRAHLLLLAGRSAQSALRPQVIARRLLVARAVLSVRRHSSLPL